MDTAKESRYLLECVRLVSVQLDEVTVTLTPPKVSTEPTSPKDSPGASSIHCGMASLQLGEVTVTSTVSVTPPRQVSAATNLHEGEPSMASCGNPEDDERAPMDIDEEGDQGYTLNDRVARGGSCPNGLNGIVRKTIAFSIVCGLASLRV